jgi:Glycosyltransferase sugar-binding region containing DXD motif
VHFIFGLRPQDEPFHLLHYLAITSCQQVVAPDEIRLHVQHLPYGLYWDLARPMVTLCRIEPVAAVDRVAAAPEVQPYKYAHHADVLRLDVLAETGGLYADIDTLFVRRPPDAWWDQPTVIGAEADVLYPSRPAPEPSVSNAWIMARAGSPFVARWRNQIIDAMDGTWSNHSCRLAARLANEHPDEVQVEPQERFSPFAHTPAGMRALLEEPLVPSVLAHSTSVHLLAHLWWGRDRRDFARFSSCDASEASLRQADTPLGWLARPYLPAHGLF